MGAYHVNQPSIGTLCVRHATVTGMSVCRAEAPRPRPCGSVAVYNDRGDEVARLPLVPTDAYVVPTGHVPLAAEWIETIPQSGTYRAQVTVTILANGKPVGTLRSRSLSLPLASGIPAPIVITITLGCGLILIFMTVFIARRTHHRRRTGLIRDRAFG